MPRVDSPLRRVERWVFVAEDARRLASLRIGLCALLALRLTMTDYVTVAAQPAPLFRSLWYMKVFEQMPTARMAVAVQVCGVLAAIAGAVGLVVRITLPAALASSLVLNGMLNSTGRIIVGDAALTLCLLVLLSCGTAASATWSLDRPHRALRSRRRASDLRVACAASVTGSAQRYGWPIRTAMATVSLSYFFAGYQKLRHSGFAWVTSDNLRWILYAASDSHAHPNAMALFIADRPLLAHLCAAGALLLETCFPLVLFVPRLRWPLIAAVIAMHESIQLALGLDYSAQWLTVLIVFVDWPVVVAWLKVRHEHDKAHLLQGLRRPGGLSKHRP